MLHDFAASRRVEDRWAPVLDGWLGERYLFREASAAEQRRGIDRVAIDDAGDEVGIDYKCDVVAGRTANVFIETVSNATTGRLGWVFASEARWIFYLVVPVTVLVLQAERLRAALPEWRRRFRTGHARNRRGRRVYSTLGVCVPMRAAEAIADQVARLDHGDEPALPSAGRDASTRGARLDRISSVIAGWWTRLPPSSPRS